MPITGSNPAAMVARLGVLRLGAGRLGVRSFTPTKLALTLGGVALRVREAGLSVTDQLNDAPNTCAFTVETTPALGQPVVIGLGTTAPVDRIFAGQVQTIDAIYELLTSQRAWRVGCIDGTARLNRRRPFGHWISVSATTIAQELIATYAPAFSAAGIEAGLPAVSLTLDGSQELSAVFSRLASDIGGYTYVSYADVVYLFTAPPTDPPDPVDATHPPLDDPPVTRTEDDSQVRTRVYVKGHGEETLAEVAAGATTVPIADAVMFNPGGGQAIAVGQVLDYTGVHPGGDVAIVGTSVTPTNPPSAAATVGTGLAPGTYQYAVTFVTAAGETLPSPVTAVAIAAGTVADPTGAGQVTWHEPGPLPRDGAVRKYAYTFRDWATGAESLSSPVSTLTSPTDVGNFGTGFYWKNFGGLPMSPLPPGASYCFYRTKANEDPVTMGVRRLPGSEANAGMASTHPSGWVDGWSDGQLLATLAPTVSTLSLHRVALDALPIGPSGTTGRTLYRTAADGSQLKLLTAIADNTTTTHTDSAADGSLGANAPTVDTSGLVADTGGEVTAGATALPVTAQSPFAAAGGWAAVGKQTLRYSGITGASLTGIPTAGAGAILTTIAHGEQALALPALTGVAGLTVVLAARAMVHLFVQRDDLDAQAARALLTGDDGIVEHHISDGRIREDTAQLWADADLARFAYPAVTVRYATRDPKTRSGKTVHIDLPSLGILGDFTVQTVTIDQIDFSPGLWPRYTVEASSVRFSLDDVLRRLQLGPG